MGDPNNPTKPVSAYVAINSPDSFTELKKGESSVADFSFARQRILVIFYKTYRVIEPGLEWKGNIKERRTTWLILLH